MNTTTLLDLQLKLLPSSPGVYLYKDKNDKIIYVGKAINLKKRVSQYFQRDDALGPKTIQLVSQIHTIDFKIVNSEIEALVLEANLIKKHRPKYNSQLKDDKSYLYILISKDKLPIVSTVRHPSEAEKKGTYGPFPSSASVKTLLKTIRRIFPFYTKLPHPKKDCLYCHLNICPGPSPDIKKYRQNIKNIKRILSGDLKKIEVQLKKEILDLSNSQNFEKAIIIRDQLTALNYIVKGWGSLNTMFDRINLIEDDTNIALSELKTTLSPYFPYLKKINRIECYDISQLGAKYFVGSMSVFDNNIVNNSEYRKFKIESHQTPNDQLMIKEVVYRRLKHPEWTSPDIILVDGGKPQVSAVDSLSSDFDLKNTVLIGLAKKNETIVIKLGDGWQEINLPKNSNALKLLQNLRDEAHRFANKYRKALISKSLTSV